MTQRKENDMSGEETVGVYRRVLEPPQHVCGSSATNCSTMNKYNIKEIESLRKECGYK